MDQTNVKTLYVFVEIAIDTIHLAQTVRLNFPDNRRLFHETLLDSEESDRDIPAGANIGHLRHLRIEGPPTASAPNAQEESDNKTTQTSPTEPTRLALVSTIQFVAALQQLKHELNAEYSGAPPLGLVEGGTPDDERSKKPVTDVRVPKLWMGRYEVTIPRSKPLSPGEILGCTAPRLGDADALIYLGDGRFHLEAIMIANPSIPAFRYDPYSKKLTRERYNHKEMRTARSDAVTAARRSVDDIAHKASAVDTSASEASAWGVVLGTLGRQGNFKQLQAITRQMTQSRTPVPYVPILLSELSPAKLSLFNPHISIFVQTSCPRLSIDWGYAFDRPLLSPYETAMALGKTEGWMEREDDVYPMDFYAAGTPWAVSRTTASFAL